MLPKIIANIIINDLSKHANEKKIKVDQLGFDPYDIFWLASLIEYEILDRTKVSRVIDQYIVEPKNVKDIITDLKLWPTFDNSKLEAIVEEVMASSQKAVGEIREGNNKAIGFLIGKLKQIDKNVDTKEAIELIRAKI